MTGVVTEMPGAPVTHLERLGSVIRMAFLVRLLALTAGMFGLVGERLTPEVLTAVLALSATSVAGLTQPRLLLLVIRHPLLATVDLLVVLGVLAGLGVESPLTLATLSTALLIGVLFPVPVSSLLTVMLVMGYAGAAAPAMRSGEDLGFFLIVGVPVTYVCLIGIGHAFRRMEQAQYEAEGRLALMLRAGATADERSRLAREVHDSLAKSLQGLALGAAALPGWVERDGTRARSEAKALADGASHAVQEARTLLIRMRSDEPRRPFPEVLEEYLQAWGSSRGHPLSTDLMDVQGLAPHARYELLAAVGEALENIRRHAPDAKVHVTLRPEGTTHAALTVTDDGPGFAPSIVSRREEQGHFGLRGMSERLAHANGTAEVRSAPGVGTTVTLTVPIIDVHLLPRR